jgi:hypothetical protein
MMKFKALASELPYSEKMVPMLFILYMGLKEQQNQLRCIKYTRLKGQQNQDHNTDPSLNFGNQS